MRAHTATFAICLWLLCPWLGVAQEVKWDVSHLADVTGELRSLPATDQHGITSRFGLTAHDPTALRITSPAGPMFLVKGAGNDICGQGGNCSFLVLDSKYRILLEKVIQSYSILPQIHHGRPDLITTMHGSAFNSGLTYWRFQGSRYFRVRCADIDYADSDGNWFYKPHISPGPC